MISIFISSLLVIQSATIVVAQTAPPSLFGIPGSGIIHYQSNDPLCKADYEMNRGGSHQQPGYPLADDSFLKARYKVAFTTYYQTFFCPNLIPIYTGINPQADDAGTSALIRAALRDAVKGDYDAGLGKLREATIADHYAGEARYLTGNLLWADGQHRDARNAWHATISGLTYAQPPDDQQLPVPKQAAQRMLKALAG
jgi:hypothetical protein